MPEPYRAVRENIFPSRVDPVIRRSTRQRERGPDPPDPPRKEHPMRFMVIVKANEESESGAMPSAEMLEEMGRYNAELVKAGVMLAGEGLHPSSKGARVRFSGDKRSVVDGPFAETKELVAGFWLWQCKSMEEAIEWARRCPNPTGEESVLEIRQVVEDEEFADVDPEAAAREAALRQQLADRQKS
jgi:hypothetical protein